jgi:glutathionylspermidine synthase
MIPLDSDIEKVFKLIPLAKAFKESSSIILILGVVMPVAMQRFSTRLYTLLLSFRARGFESVAAFIIAE